MPAADTGYADFVPIEDLALSWLQEHAQLTERDIEQVRDLPSGRTHSLLVTLNQVGTVSDDALARAYHEVTGLPVQDGEIKGPGPAEPVMSPDFMRDTKSLILRADGPLYVVDPLDQRLMRAVEFAIGRVPDIRIIRSGDWARAFSTAYPDDTELEALHDFEETAFAAELADQNRDAPIVRQVSAWLSEATDLGASDVHFDARRNSLNVMYRVDGTLKPVSSQPRNVTASVIARIKVIADLDLGERNKPQDGRATIVIRGRRLDIRVSIIPTIDGESAVIRLLDRPEGLLSLAQLGFDQQTQDQLRQITDQRHGMFIVAGPTGSGKTTTLYACIETLKGRGLKILSVEDPVEYHFDHVNQVQISEKAGRDFASALRAFLRHDPDVILVGEIRDSETAQVAVQASLSGHLVLATIHAIDAARIRTRLIDMGIEAFKLDACLLGAMAQRLVRLLCPDCCDQAELSDAQKLQFERHGLVVPDRLYIPAGCDKCHQDGYRGRTVIADLARGEQINSPATLTRHALDLVARGRTSFSEIAGLFEA